MTARVMSGPEAIVGFHFQVIALVANYTNAGQIHA
jgi:hypothetical protein